MKVFLILFVAAFASVSAHPSPATEGDGLGLVQDGDGRLRLMNQLHEDYEMEADALPFFNDASDVYFNLYTRSNPSAAQVLGTTQSVSAWTLFDPLQSTRVVVHGWNNDGSTETMTGIRDAYLANGDFNVIVVDWGAGAKTWWYPTAAGRVPAVGNRLGSLLKRLNTDFSVDLSTVIVSGHSLGAHVAGFAGKWLQANGVFNLGSIVGLDVTWTSFSISTPTGRLASTDALYVQTIHTSILGFIEQIGVASFYPNYGQSQPGCGTDLGGTCAHGRSWKYFMESINGLQFTARRCASHANITSSNCVATGANSYMGGEPLDVSAAGVYWMATNSASPFSKGAAGIV